MAFLEWADHYRTGLSPYDAQHRTLFQLANRIHDCLEKDMPATDLELSSMLGAFLEMTRTHIHTEGELMAWYEYPPAQNHSGAHHRFLQMVEEATDPSQDEAGLRSRLADLLARFKDHFENPEEQDFLALLRRRHAAGD